ncbi:MAG: helix-hairpin-helix domain-containing protein [Chitinophagaceae bacterium]|nr:helix-hairpin-helix domain-containing protein [Polaromonas sp.]
MFKKLLAFFAAMYMAVSFAAVDVNKATAAELDGIKGIGPGISTKIVDERKKGDFKDWPDLIKRVKGVGDKNATKFSAQGLTVSGAGFNGAVAKKDTKPTASTSAPAKTDAKADTKPAASASAPVKADAKADTKPAASASAPAKTDAKANTKPAASASAPAKADAKADAAKPAASATKK